MIANLFVLLAIFALTIQCVSAKTPALGSYNISDVSVSGISAGGYMAVQVHVAFSGTVSGAGIFAGGPYYCAQADLTTAELTCMYATLGVPNAAKLISTTNSDYKSGRIDNPAQMADDKVYLFSGSKDSVVNPKVMKSLQDYYAGFMPSSSIVSKFDLAAEHTFPTLSYGNACTKLGSPYIGKCDYDGAGLALSTILGGGLTRGKAVAANLLEFDQSPYVVSKSSLGDTGYIYVPTSCASGATACHLHVSFHGCNQDMKSIKDQYAADIGLNEWAEANNIIVMYPYAVSSTNPSNPNSCWDWWGYTGKDYTYKTGKQMKFVKDLIDHVKGGK